MITVRDLVMRLPSGGQSLTILDGVSLEVAAGEVVAVTGPSGSGKSTLLGLLAGLDTPSAGSITVDGVEVTRLGEAELARFRRRTIGFVFQSYHLIPTLTAARERGGSAGARRVLPSRWRPPGACSTRSASPSGPITIRRSSPAASSSAWRSRARWRWRRRCCWPTSRRGTWTRPPEATSSTCCSRSTASAGSTLLLVTHDAALAARAGRAIALRDGRLVNGQPPR